MTSPESRTGTAERSAARAGDGRDVFDTAAIRRRVLAGWGASGDRFREDANAEEDAAGAHRSRLLDELLQNAADAAGSEPGRVLVRLTQQAGAGLLEVANTGRALTAEGVTALSSLRASAKRDGATVGRFGVGFAAVLGVTDEPAIVSRSGGVRWSRARTRRLVAIAAVEAPAMRDEVARRGAAVPVLRLPFPYEVEPSDDRAVPDGYTTVVRLPLRDDDAARSVERSLETFDPSLLLVLPQLAEVRIEVAGRPERVVRCAWTRSDDAVVADLDGHRWAGVELTVDLPGALLTGRPVEERSRTSATVRAYFPGPGGWPEAVPRVFRAPQVTDDAFSLPAVLIAPFPVDAGRRRIVGGELTDFLLQRGAEVLRDLAVVTGDLGLVPVGLPAGPLDADLRDRLTALLPDAAMLPGGRRPTAAVSLELEPALSSALPALVALLQEVVPDLLSADLSGRNAASALRVLGVRRWGVADVVELLGGATRPAAWWASLYAALVPLLASASAREALGALPVPLADGRQVTGPRGVLLPTVELSGSAPTVSALAGIPLRLADPAALAGEAPRELLRALGARDATARELLTDPVLLEPDVPVDSVLTLVAAALAEPDGPRRFPALSGLLLPTADGELEPAGDLLLPGGPLDRLVVEDAPFVRVDPELAAGWPDEVLEAVGVLRTFAVLAADDVPLVPDEPLLLDLHDSDRWLTETDPPPLAERFVAVRDLELVRWPDALSELAQEPTRSVVLASDYTRWWLSAHPVLAGREPRELALPGSELAGVYDLVPDDLPPDLDRQFLTAVGVRATLSEALSEPDEVWQLFDRVADAARAVTWSLARRVYTEGARRLAGLPDEELDEPPTTIRTPDGWMAADVVVVLDRPDLAPLLGRCSALPVPLRDAAAVARVLGLRTTSSLGPFTVLSEDPLTVQDLDGEPQRVPWFAALVDPSTGAEARARSQAWTSGRWADRHRLAARLRAEQAADPSALAALRVEDDLDDLTVAPPP